MLTDQEVEELKLIFNKLTDAQRRNTLIKFQSTLKDLNEFLIQSITDGTDYMSNIYRRRIARYESTISILKDFTGSVN